MHYSYLRDYDPLTARYAERIDWARDGINNDCQRRLEIAHSWRLKIAQFSCHKRAVAYDGRALSIWNQTDPTTVFCRYSVRVRSR
jgi:hypothetical protein